MHSGSTAVAKAPLSKTCAKCHPGRNPVEESNVIIGVRTGINSSIPASADASNSNTNAITSTITWETAKKEDRCISWPER